jgi:hypothetical protein
MSENEYELIAPKREWIPDWIYKFFAYPISQLGTKQPFRWLLHRKLDPFTDKRVNRGKYKNCIRKSKEGK